MIVYGDPIEIFTKILKSMNEVKLLTFETDIEPKIIK